MTNVCKCCGIEIPPLFCVLCIKCVEHPVGVLMKLHPELVEVIKDVGISIDKIDIEGTCRCGKLIVEEDIDIQFDTYSICITSLDGEMSIERLYEIKK